MLLKYFYDKSLAHASYMVGCQRTGEAIVIDPSRSIDQYLEAAARKDYESPVRRRLTFMLTLYRGRAN